MAVKLPLGFDPVMNYARDRVNGHVQEGLARLPVPGGRVVFDISKKVPPPPPSSARAWISSPQRLGHSFYVGD